MSNEPTEIQEQVEDFFCILADAIRSFEIKAELTGQEDKQELIFYGYSSYFNIAPVPFGKITIERSQDGSAHVKGYGVSNAIVMYRYTHNLDYVLLDTTPQTELDKFQTSIISYISKSYDNVSFGDLSKEITKIAEEQIATNETLTKAFNAKKGLEKAQASATQKTKVTAGLEHCEKN